MKKTIQLKYLHCWLWTGYFVIYEPLLLASLKVKWRTAIREKDFLKSFWKIFTSLEKSCESFLFISVGLFLLSLKNWVFPCSPEFNLVQSHILSVSFYLKVVNISEWKATKLRKHFPVDTWRRLNVDKTFRRRPERLLNVLCTFSLRPVSAGLIVLLSKPRCLGKENRKIEYLHNKKTHKFY